MGQCIPYCGCISGEAVFHRWWVCPQWQPLHDELKQARQKQCLTAFLRSAPGLRCRDLGAACRRYPAYDVKILVQHNQEDAADIPATLLIAAVMMRVMTLHSPSRRSSAWAQKKWHCEVCQRIASQKVLPRLLHTGCRGVDIVTRRPTRAR